MYKIGEASKKLGLIPPSAKGKNWWNNGHSQKLCFDCLEKENFRLVFEYSEFIILILILIAIVRFDILIYIVWLKYA